MNPYRELPGIDQILGWPELKDLDKTLLTEAARATLAELRREIAENRSANLERPRIAAAVRKYYEEALSPSLRPLVNATGVILHTNLGRSPIDPEIFEEAKAIATGYCNLEYDLEAGRRGDRYDHTTQALSALLGCEDALIVNNNAAAVFLILNTFAQGREAVVSRGELVEIGGSFRIPEVMAASGAILREIGTTNKTRLADYEAAINDRTALLMKVHKSNYTIEGFSSEVDMADISALAQQHSLIDYYDLGSAYLPELPWGLGRSEPSLPHLLERGPSLLSFSGDKLFGGVQAGIILGRRELIAELKRNQILRMFRVDKLTLALLERTLLAYRRQAYERIPVLRMLFATPEELERKAQALKRRLPLKAQVLASDSYVGGGTMPNRKIPTVVLGLEGDPTPLEAHFRRHRIIGRIENDRFVLDMRTVEESDFDTIVEAAGVYL